MEAIWELHIPFDILDAATPDALSGYVPGWVEFTREQVTSGSVIYRLHNKDLGELGELRLRKQSDWQSEIMFSEPALPPTSSLDRNWVFGAQSLPEADRRARHIDLLESKRLEAMDLHQRRIKHQENVIQVYFETLEEDPAAYLNIDDYTARSPLAMKSNNPELSVHNRVSSAAESDEWIEVLLVGLPADYEALAAETFRIARLVGLDMELVPAQSGLGWISFRLQWGKEHIATYTLSKRKSDRAQLTIRVSKEPSLPSDEEIPREIHAFINSLPDSRERHDARMNWKSGAWTLARNAYTGRMEALRSSVYVYLYLLFRESDDKWCISKPEALSMVNEELHNLGWQQISIPDDESSSAPDATITSKDVHLLDQSSASIKDTQVFEEPTGWQRVDRGIYMIRRSLEQAENEEQFQTIGLLCREVLISVAQVVYDPQRHLSEGGAPSETDAKRMLDGYFAVELFGGVNEGARQQAKATLALANNLQHHRTADYRQAALCAEATTSVVNIVAIIAGQRDR